MKACFSLTFLLRRWFMILHIFLTSYWKRVHNYFGTSEAVFYMFYSQMVSVSWFNYIFIWKRLLCRGKLFQKMLSDEQLLIILRWQIDFDWDKKRPQTTKQFTTVGCLATSVLYFRYKTGTQPYKPVMTCFLSKNRNVCFCLRLLPSGIVLDWN